MKIYVSAIVEKDNKYLLIQEAKKSVYGKWNIPSGHLEEDEYIFDAAVREVKEETGGGVQLTGLVSIYNNMYQNSNSISFIFSSKIIESNEITFNKEEILDAKWFSFEELKDMKDELRDYNYIVDSIERLRNNNVKPLDTIIVR